MVQDGNLWTMAGRSALERQHSADVDITWTDCPGQLVDVGLVMSEPPDAEATVTRSDQLDHHKVA
ncbi:hypothetical protein PC116_g2936 [Phytophthora cactorum]|uniref:Uncharacterized protein n=1 Tax=Phytophthora cactorum TaxID=29920 RepID=A0A8T1LII8_9STRA|nr:hypothetical protein Pcac1_g16756 [Phytophthora cactorum]KAG2776081.1 hypothetical protein Pcac1_g13365 [Phytophthora cactorum]KAG2890766.1 hypothetical protein PC114_g17289 [Phytophthora cactorum]KAG2920318.1 hypothetical protein PC117_g16522 [Phytophthora cactorum]KAG3013113.1 hypothetical protein PC119_g12648 [Phytophthora cactorum]